MVSGTRSTLKLMGRYEETPGDRVDGAPTYILTDIKGRILSRVQIVDDYGNVTSLRADHQGNLHVTHAHNLQSIMVNQPGVAYVNGVNALCIAVPSDEDHQIEIVNIYLSTDTAGSFYLVIADLGLTPGATTDNTFDLVGVLGDGITDTCDVAWAAFLAAQGRGLSSGEYHMDIGAGNELYLLAPDVDYHIHVGWIDEL